MSELKPRIYDEANSLDYVLIGDCYVLVIELPENDGRPNRKCGNVLCVTIGYTPLAYKK